LTALSIGSANQLLTSVGGLPTWVTSSAFNFFQKNLGAIAPLDTSNDFLLGGGATASDKFAFINNATGTPTASIAAQDGTGAALALTPNAITTQNGQTLTLGGPATGNIILNSAGTNALTIQGANLVAGGGTLTGLGGLTSSG